jgi:inosose dehydratase
VKWGLGSNLWNSFPRVPFTDILDVMKDTGFIGIRLTQFPQILKTYDITAAQMQKEAEKRGCQIVTISFNGSTHDPAQRAEVVKSAKVAMNFLKDFGANHLVVFPPNRKNLTGDASFAAMCESFNAIGSAAREMGFYAGLHNHMGEMVQTPEEVDRCMAMTDPKLFYFSPDTAHLHLAGCDVVKTLEKHKHRLMLADYKDAKRLATTKPDSFDRESIFDLGDGDIDFIGCHRVLKSISFKGFLIVDLDIARQGPRASYERSSAYVVNKLDPVYA